MLLLLLLLMQCCIYRGVEVSDCGRYVVCSIRHGCDPVNRLYFCDLSSLTDGISGNQLIRILLIRFWKFLKIHFLIFLGPGKFLKTELGGVRTILVLGYRVLANTGRYWGGWGVGRYFFDCETRYRYPSHRPPLSASGNQTAVGSRWRPLSTARRLSHSLCLISVTDVRSVADVGQRRQPASRAWPFLLSPVHCGKGYWRQEAHAIVWWFMYLITRPSKLLVDGCCDYITFAAWRRY